MVTEIPRDPYRAQCRTRGVLDRIGDRWTILIIGALADGEAVRFTDLLYAIEGISQKMLTKNLRALERDGIVTRTVHPTSPVRIDYQLTALGRTLLEPLAALRAWAVDHLGDVIAAQTSHDHEALDRHPIPDPVDRVGGDGQKSGSRMKGSIATAVNSRVR